MSEPNATNGNGRFAASTPVTFATALVVFNLVLAVAGLGSLWGSQNARVEEIRERLTSLESSKKDSVALNDRMIVLESDVKYISQTVAELKLKIK